MAFTPNDLKRIIDSHEEVAPGWTQSQLDSYWAKHVEDDTECSHHCCCCCDGLAAGEHF